MLQRFLKTKREANQKKLRSLLTPFVSYLHDRGVPIDEFGQAEVIDYIRKEEYSRYTRKDELSKRTLRQIYLGISNFVKWQRSRADTPKSHFKQSKRYERIKNLDLFDSIQRLEGRKWLKLQELNKLLEVSAKKNERDYSIFYLLGYFGCRVSELMDPENRLRVDFEENRFNILTEKAKFERINFFDDYTSKIFQSALRRGWLDGKFPYHRLGEYRPFLDVDKFTPHNLRYTANHHFKKTLNDSELVSLILGWSLNTDKEFQGSEMMQYYDDREEDIRRAMTQKHYYDQLEVINP